jgi:hypothetical protein
MKIRFFEAQDVYAQGKIEQQFKAGQVVELSDASARHWLSRNMAEVVGGKNAEAEAPKAPEDSGPDHPVVEKLKAQKPAKAPKKRHFGSEG